ncbi:hypothetical protein, partial [Enterobacter hormaechei]|uniref:hypothetical protein n=1 Tax=Enterobacter hormaechei TaxID=158836 RepID=UPI001F1891DF
LTPSLSHRGRVKTARITPRFSSFSTVSSHLRLALSYAHVILTTKRVVHSPTPLPLLNKSQRIKTPAYGFII